MRRWWLPALLVPALALGAEDVIAPPEDAVDPVQPDEAPVDPTLLELPPPRPDERTVTAFAILDDVVLPGTRRMLSWNSSQNFAGNDVTVPVIVAHGARPGPVMCLTAGIHGDEINGIEIVRRLANTVQPDRLAGTVIGVPVVNLFGYQRSSRYLPDRRDLNRFFPGSEGGSIASRIAHSFFENVVRHCDLLIDFHTGSFDRANLPQVRSDLRNPAIVDFTRAFGATVVLHSRGSPGMLRHAAAQAGIPAVTFEVGAPVRLEPGHIDVAVDSVKALLANLGMEQREVGETEPHPTFLVSRWIRADSGGLLISDVELGDRVRPGQRLGRVVDPLRNTEDPIISPVHGRVVGQAQNQQVLPGFAIYHLGEVTSEARAVEEAAAGIGESVDGDEGERN
ncbi:MAG: succinylglutamate desuccinylase/aspartoacylase family protein [Lysobacteraceae bacterium]